MRKVTRLIATLGSTLALAASGLLSASQASAAPVGIVCALGSQSNTYTPPLTNTPQPLTAHVNENYSCTSLLTGVSSASGSATIEFMAGCLLTALPLVSDELTYTWSTGQASTILFNNTTEVRAANGTATITSTGSVTSGLGQGSTATRVVVLPALSLTACATTGVSAQTGTATLAVL
ncbi:hypothetical protein [Streptomyces sp. NPDC005012]|uniref:hypothetical protein n=1 Tax=Streptomyces sp. NPDC005012 TaxID=3154558 RepID=UPI0033B74DF6